MSLSIIKTINCECGNKFEADVYLSVNITTDPQLKKKVLDGKINSVVCPECGRQHYLEPFLYTDMKKSFRIEINPAKIDREKIKKLIKKLEREHTLTDTKKRKIKRVKEMRRIEKEFQKNLGITSEEYLSLPYEKSRKMFEKFLVKKEKQINAELENAKTNTEKEKLFNLKKKIEESKNLFKDSF